MKKVLIIILVVVAVAAAGFGVYSLVKKEDTTSHDHAPGTAEHSHDAETTTNSHNTKTDPGNEAAETAVITYTNSGFSPETITVASGATITIKNDSSRDMQLDSDPHPAHTTNEELNVEIVKPGQSQTFVVKRTGTFGYHNHLNSSQTGTIIVE